GDANRGLLPAPKCDDSKPGGVKGGESRRRALFGPAQVRKIDQAFLPAARYSRGMTTPTDQTYRQRILKVQVFIQEHLAEELPLDRLARVAHFSPYHFHRIFRALVGEGVSEHVRRLRLEAAAVALKTTRRSVIAVALDVGYGTHEAFTRAFRPLFGVSPSQYRNDNRPTPVPKEAPAMSPVEVSREVRLEPVPARRVAFLRHVGPYGSAGPAWQKLVAWAGPRGLFFRPGPMMLGICHDDPD